MLEDGLCVAVNFKGKSAAVAGVAKGARSSMKGSSEQAKQGREIRVAKLMSHPKRTTF